MIAIFWGLLWIITVFLTLALALALAVLLVPIKVDVVWRSSTQGHFLVTVRWFGGATPPYHIIDSDRPKKEKKQKNKRKPNKDGSKKKRRDRLSKIWRGGSVTPEFLMGHLRQIRFDRVFVDADIGLTNPADTGHLYGLLAPLIYAMPPSSPLSIMVRPDFENVRFDGEIDAGARVIPLTLMPSMARFAWHIFGPRR